MAADLLPGVSPQRPGPTVVCDSRRVIARARRLAVAREVLQVALLVGVNALLLRVPGAHVPLLRRETSLVVVALFNGLVGAHLFVSRRWPLWNARRIAATWDRAERARLGFE